MRSTLEFRVATLNLGKAKSSLDKRKKLRKLIYSRFKNIDIIAFQEPNFENKDLLDKEFNSSSYWFTQTGWILLNRAINVIKWNKMSNKNLLSINHSVDYFDRIG